MTMTDKICYGILWKIMVYLIYTISISCGWRLNEGIHEAKKD